MIPTISEPKQPVMYSKVKFEKLLENALEYNENNVAFTRQRLRRIRYLEFNEEPTVKASDKIIPFDTDYYYGKMFVEFMNQQRDLEFQKLNPSKDPPPP